MISNDRSFTFDRVVRLALFAGLAWCLVLLLDYLSDVLLPFFAGLVVAYFLDPVTNQVQHVIKLRVLAALFTLSPLHWLSLSLSGSWSQWSVMNWPTWAAPYPKWPPILSWHKLPKSICPKMYGKS